CLKSRQYLSTIIHLCTSMLISSISFSYTITPTTEFYTLSLHDALPILTAMDADFLETESLQKGPACNVLRKHAAGELVQAGPFRSEEHTSELQSRSDLVCRLLLEKKNHGPNAVRVLDLGEH